MDKNNEISDVNLYSIGLLDSSKLEAKMKKIQSGEKVEENQEVVSYTFDELLNLKYKLVLNTDYYKKEGDIWINKSENVVYMKKLIEDAIELKVVGIVRQSEEAVSSSIGGAVGYTRDLTEYVINNINDREIVKEQKENPNVDVFTGRTFTVEDGENDNMMPIDMSTLTDEEKAYLSSFSQEELQAIMKQQTTASNATYEGNLSLLGCVDLDNPSVINIYAKNFEAKESIGDIITDYNNQKIEAGEEEYVVTYNDIVGIIMSSVTSIIDIISYVLIAFVAISLVVSSIMIGIITYISVLERTKEIGILRSIGASKRDISRVFNAETVIVGFAAGAIGIIVTILLNIPINYIIKMVSGISGVSRLPIAGAIILIVISMILTVIAGLIPSKVASNKDPVEALRTE